MIGGRSHQHVTHIVLNPVEVSLEHTEDGANHALAIKSADDATTLLCFRRALGPEFVDVV
jgi:hypothetical protein